jgi:uncharacterized membrane protein YdjX (TVP38/TMEM64 family)
VLAGCVTAFGIVYRDALTLGHVAAYEAELQAFRGEHPALTYAAAFAVYVAVTATSIPAATILALVIGWQFGFWPGLVLVSFASTTGATLAFLLSRHLLRDAVQRRYGPQLKPFQEALERDGAFYLFALRLTPVVPFFVINLVMGLTNLRVWTFWWVSQVGMLAASSVFVYAGSMVPDLRTLAVQGTDGILTPQVIGAFLLLGIFPLAARWLFSRIPLPSRSVRAERT